MRETRASLSSASAVTCLGALALLVPLLSCSGSDCPTCPSLPMCPTPTPAPTPEPAPGPEAARNGYWRGWGDVDDQPYGVYISFTLKDNVVDNVRHTFGYACPEGALGWDSLDETPWDVDDDQATILVDNWGWRGTIVGRFESDTTGEATWSLSRTASPCLGSTLSASITIGKLGPLLR